MKYDFDKIIDRKNTNSLKYDFAKEREKPEDTMPLWVADMDFQAPVEVTTALVKSAEHAIFGYTETKEDYFNAIHSWFLKGFNYETNFPWLVKTPGVVFAIAMAIRAFTKIDDAVLIQSPVYYPFSEVILANGRKLIKNSLVYEKGSYHIDFEDFQRKIVDNNIKLFVLCSPHNPVGRVWTSDELIQMGNICLKHDCLIVSDEIHCDFLYDGFKHYVFGSLSSEFSENSIVCTAPSKTFNLAGLQIANIFIANPKIRKMFLKEITMTGYSQMNTMGLAACQSAYEHGSEWLVQLKEYLADNLSFLREFLCSRLPSVKLVEPEGTYLVWLDFTALNMTQPELDNLILHKAKLWLDSGTMFGSEGEGFQRINIACPRKILKTALENLENAIIF